MPQYFFQVRVDGKFIEDDEGCEHCDLEFAIAEAVQGVRGLVCGDIRDGILHRDLAIDILEASGRHLETVTFDDAIRIVPGGRRSTSANDA